VKNKGEFMTTRKGDLYQLLLFPLPQLWADQARQEPDQQKRVQMIDQVPEEWRCVVRENVNEYVETGVNG